MTTLTSPVYKVEMVLNFGNETCLLVSCKYLSWEFPVRAGARARGKQYWTEMRWLNEFQAWDQKYNTHLPTIQHHKSIHNISFHGRIEFNSNSVMRALGPLELAKLNKPFLFSKQRKCLKKYLSFIYEFVCVEWPLSYIEFYNIYFAAYFRYFHGAGEELWLS